LIASGGAGTVLHFEAVFRDADVDGALAASVFHSGAIAIPRLKQALSEQGIAIRLHQHAGAQSLAEAAQSA